MQISPRWARWEDTVARTARLPQAACQVGPGLQVCPGRHAMSAPGLQVCPGQHAMSAPGVQVCPQLPGILGDTPPWGGRSYDGGAPPG